LSDETVAMPSAGGGRRPPPGATQPLYVGDSGLPPTRGRQALIIALAVLIGLGGGFAIAQFVGQKDERIPDEDLVLYESSTTTFPIDGAQFTRSTFNLQTQKCDKESLKQFLRADQKRFDAWLDLQGITASQFDSFVDRLETQILTEPTAVTNHGCFADGPCPFAIQSVLGPGTPVWFDPDQNRVVAKCTCSSPLKAPRCPPNCENQPTPTPSPSPTPSATATPTQAPTPTPTQAPTPTPTLPPTTAPPPPTTPALPSASP
jgi:hypothetical protein